MRIKQQHRAEMSNLHVALCILAITYLQAKRIS